MAASKPRLDRTAIMSTWRLYSPDGRPYIITDEAGTKAFTRKFGLKRSNLNVLTGNYLGNLTSPEKSTSTGTLGAVVPRVAAMAVLLLGYQLV